jgi:murein DD-endopeptidase MepM/ murein hydrolase activator NlpD
MKKRERYLSIIITPHHKAGQISLEFSYTALRWLLVVGIVLLLGITFFVINYGHVYWRAGQYELMRKRQKEMEAEFAKLSDLKAEISRMKTTEGKLNAMLGVSSQPDTISVKQIMSAQPAGGETVSATTVAPAVPGSTAARRTTVPSIMPAKGWVSAGMSPGHTGVDIAAREGDPVWAAADGQVIFAGWDNYFGNKVEIKHSEKFTTMYGHNAKLLVKTGDKVKQGQVIALIGTTGQSSGPHLHYEVKISGQPADPANYWVNK